LERVPGESIEEAEERRKFKEIERDIGENCRSLRENPATHIVAYSEYIPE
jgi:hypothetical protein